MSNYREIQGQAIKIAGNVVRAGPFIAVAFGFIKYISLILPRDSKEKLQKKIEDSYENMKITEKYTKEGLFKKDIKFLGGISLVFTPLFYIGALLDSKGLTLTYKAQREFILFSLITTGGTLLCVLPIRILYKFLTNTEYKNIDQTYLPIKKRCAARASKQNNKQDRAQEICNSKQNNVLYKKLENKEERKFVKELFENGSKLKYIEYLIETRVNTNHRWPQDLICPYSRGFITMPIIAPDGQTYNLDSLVNWYLEGNYSCPANAEIELTDPYQLPINMTIARKIVKVITENEQLYNSVIESHESNLTSTKNSNKREITIS